MRLPIASLFIVGAVLLQVVAAAPYPADSKEAMAAGPGRSSSNSENAPTTSGTQQGAQKNNAEASMNPVTWPALMNPGNPGSGGGVDYLRVPVGSFVDYFPPSIAGLLMSFYRFC
ncbi:hypothetical protein EV361DRAFT_901160 [Lentinula raphanica]|nr:hypothetical protein EV361DRAFT_901160 [Lentinula raphanica]